jgi:hypothetical protein
MSTPAVPNVAVPFVLLVTNRALVSKVVDIFIVGVELPPLAACQLGTELAPIVRTVVCAPAAIRVRTPDEFR